MPLSKMVILVLMAAWLQSCTLVGEDDLYGDFDQSPPRVVKSLPADGWIQVPTGLHPKVWFSEPLDPASVSLQSLHLFTGQELVVCSYLVSEEEDGSGLVELEPVLPMIGGVRHRLRVTSGVTDLLGNPLEEPVEILFTTMR